MSVDTGSLPKPAAKILRAASALFARKGLAGTTTRMIAAKARMNEALIFRYFPTKRHLYAAILETHMAEKELFYSIEPDAKDLGIFLRTLAARMIQRIRRDPQFLRLLYFSGLEGHKLASTFYERTLDNCCGYVARQFDASVKRGELRTDVDTKLAARSFLGMVAHHALANEVFQLGASPWSDEELVNTFTGLFLDGMRKPGAEKKGAR